MIEWEVYQEGIEPNYKDHIQFSKTFADICCPPLPPPPPPLQPLFHSNKRSNKKTSQCDLLFWKSLLKNCIVRTVPHNREVVSKKNTFFPQHKHNDCVYLARIDTAVQPPCLFTGKVELSDVTPTSPVSKMGMLLFNLWISFHMDLQGFHMVKKCSGGWHFGECSICIDFSLEKRKENVFLEPTSPLIRRDKTSSTRQS